MSELHSFFISNQCWTAEILSHFHYLAIKNRNKEMLGVYCFCSKTGFLSPISSFSHFFHAFGTQKVEF